MPDKWYSETALADWIMLVDPYLLLSTPARLHQLFGKKPGSDRYVLPLPTAKKFMCSEKWDKAKSERLKEAFGEELGRLGNKAKMQLERLIDEGSVEAIKIGLEMAGIWQKGLKITHTDDRKRAKKLGKLASEYQKMYTEEDVKDLEGNN